jgi:hypothetical protein
VRRSFEANVLPEGRDFSRASFFLRQRFWAFCERKKSFAEISEAMHRHLD